ncbi:MAG: hypothetical protein ACJA1A_000283 [Saprospiraceae bacterium]|jgi:hypothetical protein
MDLEGLEDDAKKENIISIIAQMSKVDGQIHEYEVIYLLKLGLSLGLSDEKVREIIISDEKFLFIPKSEQERVTILYYLIFLLKVDGVVNKKEEEMLHHFGLKLGFSPLLIGNIIDVVKAQNGEELQPDTLLNEVKKYLN